MHITDWLEMLGEHFPLVVIGCAEALLAVVLLCAALRNRRQCADKKRSALRRAERRFRLEEIPCVGRSAAVRDRSSDKERRVGAAECDPR